MKIWSKMDKRDKVESWERERERDNLQNLRIPDQGPGDGDALLLTAA